MHQNIFIIGPLGAGKSSVGFHIAKRLRMRFYDSDREVENRSGVDIDWMFAIEGEAGFRSREQQVIEELSQQPNTVIATGGGTVVIPECRAALSSRGICVYLQVPYSEQLSRVKRFPAKRPMLENNPEVRLQQLNDQRQALYEEIADLSYTNNTSNAQKLAIDIIKDIKKIEQNNPKDSK